MNWKVYANEKPEAEPKREILVRFDNGHHMVCFSTEGSYPRTLTHWAEIEPPMSAEMKKLAEQGKAVVDRELAKHKARKAAEELADLQANYEVWFERNSDDLWIELQEFAEKVWMAAIRHAKK